MKISNTMKINLQIHGILSGVIASQAYVLLRIATKLPIPYYITTLLLHNYFKLFLM